MRHIWRSYKLEWMREWRSNVVVDIFRRDPKTAEPVKMGSVRFDGTNVTFHGMGVARGRSLQRISLRGRALTPLDGVEYMQALPFYLSGGYMWASRPRND